MTSNKKKNVNDFIYLYATFPFVKRDRENFDWLYKKMYKQMKKISAKKGFPFRRKPLAALYELNIFLQCKASLLPHKYSEKNARVALEKDLYGIYSQYNRRIEKKQKKRLKKDVELMDTKNILKKVRPQLTSTVDEKIDAIVLESANNIINVLRQSISYIWDMPGHEIDRIIIGTTPIEINGNFTPLKNNGATIGDLADDVSFLSLATQIIPILHNLLSKIELSQHIEGIIEELNKLVDTGLPSEHSRQNLDDINAIFVGKVLSIREDLWLARKIVERILELENEMNDAATELNNENIKKLYEDFIRKDMLQEINEKAEQFEAIINSYTMQLRKMTYKIAKCPINTNASPIPEKLIFKILELYAMLERFRIFVQMWYDLPFFVNVETGLTETFMQKQDKTKVTPYIIDATNLFKTYHGKETTTYALRGVSLKIKPGEFVAIVGPSGSGKTTLLNLLSGLDKPDKGEIFVDGKNLALMTEKELVAFRRKTIAFIFQDFALLQEFTALENVVLPGILAGASHPYATGNQLLEQVGISEYKTHLPLQLSGGQQQRVAIARAFINSPKIIFADEPTGSLDKTTGLKVMELLKTWNKKGFTIIIVTHDLEMATFADRVVILVNGKVKEELEHPDADTLIKVFKQISD